MGTRRMATPVACACLPAACLPACSGVFLLGLVCISLHGSPAIVGSSPAPTQYHSGTGHPGLGLDNEHVGGQLGNCMATCLPACLPGV